MTTLDSLLAARRAVVRPAEPAGVAQGPAGAVVASLELPRELTAATVGPTRAALQAWLAQRPAGQAWCLLAAGVEQVDAAGVQMLLALASHAAANYVRLRLLEPSAALVSACAGLGLAEVLLEPEGVDHPR